MSEHPPGESGPTSFVGWIDALPLPAAIIQPFARGSFRVHAGNAAFDRLALAQAGTATPVELLRAIADAARHPQGRREFSFRTGVGDAARDLTGTIGPLSAECGGASLCLLTLIDRTRDMATERDLRRELTSDNLTGLPNRPGFTEMLEARKAVRSGDDHAILLIDLARFSRINEHIGPAAGDELIIIVARRLKANLRSGDILARTGGDEFAISTRIAAGKASARDDVHEIARRLRRCFEHPFRIGEVTVRVDCALGCALQSVAGAKVADLIRHAQIALKRAKRTGHIEIHEPGTPRLIDDRFGMETELRSAIEAGRLRLDFQPLVELETGRVAGFEALARWTNRKGRLIPPAEFIPVAEDSGLIVPLGRWVIGKAAATLADWDRQNRGERVDCHVSVNVSAIQLVRDDIAAAVHAALSEHRIGGERLMIELTESAIVGDPDRAMTVLRRLKTMNARVAMDDFGTGYSNLAHLHRLPIDVLKIDRSFVEHMVEDRDKVAIVRTIQSLAEALDLSTTAEGVETIEQARLLSAIGCDFGQGFLFARPMDATSAFAYWRRSRTSPIV